MDKKYFVLFTSLFVYVNSHLIEFMDSTPRHISNTFMTDIYAFILFILGVLYFALCQLKVDKKQKQLINICIFYTIAFPLLSLRTMYLDSNFDIQFFSWLTKPLFNWGTSLFFVVQFFACTQLFIFLKKEKSIV